MLTWLSTNENMEELVTLCERETVRESLKLERIQERGLWAVFKDKLSSYEKLLAKADIPSSPRSGSKSNESRTEEATSVTGR